MRIYITLIALVGFVAFTNAQVNTEKLLNKQQKERQTLETQQRSELNKIKAERDAKINGLDAERRALIRENDKKIADLKARGFKEGTGAPKDQVLVSQKRQNALAKVDLDTRQAKIREEANATFNSKNKQLAERFANQQKLLINSQTAKKDLALKQDKERKEQQAKTSAKLREVVTKEAQLKDKFNTDLRDTKRVYGDNSKQRFERERELLKDQKDPLNKLNKQRSSILNKDKTEKSALLNKQKGEKSLVKKQINERDALMKKQSSQRQELKDKLVKNNVPKEKANKILAKQQKVNQRPIKELNKRQAKETKKFNKNATAQKSSSGIKSKVKKAIKKVTPSKSNSSSSKAVKKTSNKKKTRLKKRG